MLRSRRGMTRSYKVSADGVSAGRSRCSHSFIVILVSAHSHTDHLPESNHCAKQQPDQIEPLSMQPVIRQLTQKETEQDHRRNNKPHLGIASERDERIFLSRRPVGLEAGLLRHSVNSKPANN